MNTTKPFMCIEDQIKLLQSRGLSIPVNQLDKAKEFLINNNYYRISGYSLTLRENDVFQKNVVFETLFQIYEADRRMRHIMLSITEVIEIRLKTLVAYFHSEKSGPLGYLDINNFNCSKNGNIDIPSVNNYLRITRKAELQTKSLTESELFLKHHRDNKRGILPFWVYVEVLTISDISKLYTLLSLDIQKKIAAQFGFTKSNGQEVIENLFHCVTILRNICAHGGRLYNRLFIRKPWLSSKEKALLRVENRNPVFNKLFSYILVLKSLVHPDDFSIVVNHIHQISAEYPLTDFKFYGFPDNWKEIFNNT
ncbi:MAG: Abi family protein [Desulfitobacteriaceae bacterium]